MHSQLSAPIGVADNGETLGPLADKASHRFKGANGKRRVPESGTGRKVYGDASPLPRHPIGD